MNNTIRNLLYDYVKGTCSDSQKQQVEQELARSEELRNELTRVKKYYDSVAMVDPEKVSGQFLAGVHSRIEKTQKKTLFERLFFPLHVKLPAELIGVACTVLLVVYYFVPRLPTKESAVSGYETAYSEVIGQPGINAIKDSAVAVGSIESKPEAIPLSSEPTREEKMEMVTQKRVAIKSALPERATPTPLQKSAIGEIHEELSQKTADKELAMSAPAPASIAPATPVAEQPMPVELSGALQSNFADAKSEPMLLQDNAASVYQAKSSRERRSNGVERNEEIEMMTQTVKWTLSVNPFNKKVVQLHSLSERKKAAASISSEKESADEAVTGDGATIKSDETKKIDAIIKKYSRGSVAIDSTTESTVLSAQVETGNLQKLFTELSAAGNISGTLPRVTQNSVDTFLVILTLPK